MAGLIEDYALIGDMQTAALVGRDGSVDWLCLPRFDSDACFAALLGDERNGQWRICPTTVDGPVSRRGEVSRQYLGDSLILETTWRTFSGAARVIDFMPPRDGADPVLVRIVEGLEGSVEMESVLRLRFGYGKVMPWVRRNGTDIRAIAGPDSVCFHGSIRSVGQNMAHEAVFDVKPGDRHWFVLTWKQSHLAPDPCISADLALAQTKAFWSGWASACTYHGPYREAVIRSLITLKALTYAPTGGIVAAPTTSLPEDIGGVRNWDYRYCWLRDATITLKRCCAPVTRPRPKAGGSGLAVPSRATRRTSRSCTGLAASDGSPSGKSAGCPATSGRRRSGSATPPWTSASWMSTAR